MKVLEQGMKVNYDIKPDTLTEVFESHQPPQLSETCGAGDRPRTKRPGRASRLAPVSLSRSPTQSRSATAVRDLPPLIDVARATANGAHVVVVRGVAAPLRVRELRGVVRLARVIGGVDAPLQRLGSDSGRQRWARVARGAKPLHVTVVGQRRVAGGRVPLRLVLHLRADAPGHVHRRRLRVTERREHGGDAENECDDAADPAGVVQCVVEHGESLWSFSGLGAVVLSSNYSGQS